jgi:hypothetical protein
MDIIAKIVSKIELIKDKEGRKLEDKDIEDIKIFRGLYTTASNDFITAQKEWAEKKLEDENKYLSDLKDTDTNNFFIGASKLFDEAKSMLNDLIRNSQLAVNNKKGDDNKGAENLAAGDIIKGGKKYSKDSKEGKIVIEVKKTIYAKFKKYARVIKSDRVDLSFILFSLERLFCVLNRNHKTRGDSELL